MRVHLNYGRGRLSVQLPETWKVTLIGKPPMPVLPDAESAVQAALENPVNCLPLAREARGKRSACILICDITRPVPNGIILPALVRVLLGAGLRAEDIQVVVATGLHRPNTGTELEELVGDPWVLRTVQVTNHDARNDAAHVDLGQTARGTPVRLERRFVEGDLRIVTGLVEPHFMAGWSGGRKVIAPGAAHRDTITTFHSARFMEHPRAANCVLEGNPLHEEQLEIVQRIGGALAVNAVIDEHRRPAFFNFGEIVSSHLEAVAFVRGYAQIPVPRRFKTVLTSAAGYPLDKTYYQTVKGMVGAMEILEPGGHLVIVSECSEGMGSSDYLAAQRRLIERGTTAFLEDIGAKQHAGIDEWQTEMQLKPIGRGTLHLYSPGLSPEHRALTGVHVVDSVEETLARCVADAGDTHVAVIPEGPYVVPVYRPEA